MKRIGRDLAEHRVTRSLVIYTLAVCVGAVVLSSGFAIWFVNHQNQVWCDALVPITANDPRKLPPTTSAAGKGLKENQVNTYKALVKVRREFCD
jgi:hypothetical protein